MVRAPFPWFLCFALASCAGDLATHEEDRCACPPATALATSYDNGTSMLAADNVQDAVDELDAVLGAQAAAVTALEARPLPETPIVARLEIVADEFANSGARDVFAMLACPRNDDVALGGSCGTLGGGSLAGTHLLAGAFQCAWNQPEGGTDPLRLRVLCLHPSAP